MVNKLNVKIKNGKIVSFDNNCSNVVKQMEIICKQE